MRPERDADSVQCSARERARRSVHAREDDGAKGVLGLELARALLLIIVLGVVVAVSIAGAVFATTEWEVP